jgi:hypothetical protein
MNKFSWELQNLVIALAASSCSTLPTTETFFTIVIGWLLCSGKRTTSGIIRAAGPHATKSHDTYHHFFSLAKWSMEELSRMFFLCTIHLLNLTNTLVWIAGDDTLAKHYGRKIYGAGSFRDAVRSSKKHIAYAWGHNWVVLVLIVAVPFLQGKLIAIPIYARLNPKKDAASKKGRGSKKKKTTVTIMAEMITTVTQWLPDAQFMFCGDGAYAGISKYLPANVTLVSRIRCDAAIFEQLKEKKGKKRPSGRPAQKGKRLPSPEKKAQSDNGWKEYTLVLYGKKVKRHIQSYTVVWPEGCLYEPILIVTVKDPAGECRTEYFFSTDPKMTPEKILYIYTGRWPIEVVFRESKQYLGLQDGQARTQKAVEKITPFCLWLNALIKVWFISDYRNAKTFTPTIDDWYTDKSTISFQDMLAALRRQYWENCIFETSTNHDDFEKFQSHLLNVLTRVG